MPLYLSIIVIMFLVCFEVCVKYGLYIAMVLFIPCFIAVVIYYWYFYYVKTNVLFYDNIKWIKPDTLERVVEWIERKEDILDFLSTLGEDFIVSFFIYALLEIFII